MKSLKVLAIIFAFILFFIAIFLTFQPDNPTGFFVYVANALK